MQGTYSTPGFHQARGYWGPILPRDSIRQGGTGDLFYPGIPSGKGVQGTYSTPGFHQARGCRGPILPRVTTGAITKAGCKLQTSSPDAVAEEKKTTDGASYRINHPNTIVYVIDGEAGDGGERYQYPHSCVKRWKRTQTSRDKSYGSHWPDL